ncbi:Protein MICAL-3 [Temnothorax longispinosus]|uniref:F-actin monooxygenase n=1 Tax=Temnothorax longispinosus TaxID=300112 RepID=A0A4S2KMY7_9HYME|nr:Protein MICAL-3 [Temnothorax longispinosus]
MDQIGKKQAANSPEVALASEIFDQFCNAATLKSILSYYRQLCELLKIRPNAINQFYPKLKTKLRSWKAQALWKKFDQRANHKCYNRGKVCPNTRVLIIGGGPCGLRTAIEAQLLGAKVVVVEKRDRMSRNNVLHLWPFVIQDLRGLGAKKFFGKFCAGSIDHISIRQLQCILLKVALILGVEFHENVSFDSLIQPPDNQEDGKIGWRAKTSPADHPVSQYEFDVLIGADGKRNTLEGFKRKEFRGKLAIAITANFINKRTEAEARVEEISGVAFIFNQKFFKELYQETGIDLENIVYYKDDTHYFVMTAKKHSLIDKGVILRDHADTAKLLAKENVDREALMLYAREAAEFSTEYQMMDMEFAVNHYGQPDVAMFDFTSMYAAENASRVLERHGHRLLMILVGDSLLEPFWPTGSGCARGFLSSLDAGWAIKGWGASLLPLEVIAERESIYRLLGQTTPENLNRDYAAYTLDPHTRYPNLNVRSVTPIQVRSLLDTDDPESIKQPAIQSEIDIPKKRKRRDLRADTQVHPDTLLRWLQKQVALYDKVHIEDMGASFKDGLAICAIVHRYRPDLIDFYSLNAKDAVKNNQLAFDTLDKELNIPPIMTGEEMVQCDVPDTLAMFSYLTQIYEVFRGEIPYIKHPKLEPEAEECTAHPKQLKQWTSEEKATKARHSRSRHANENVHSYVDKKDNTVGRRSRKRRSTEKVGATMDERQKKLDEIEKHRTERMKKRQYLRKMATEQFYKSMQMLQANAKREKDEPFEDYSIFLYRQTAPDFKDRVKDLEQKILYPDRQPKVRIGHRRGSVDEEFSGRIKDFEDKLKGTTSSEKKPRDLLRAIGKIEKTDWNVKEIEKKIEENKMGRGVRHERVEKVPKWSREQLGRSRWRSEATIKEIPTNTKPAVVLPVQGGSEMCHFCNKRVYLMERLSAEGKFFHRGCFRCEYCSISLRIGNHTFDREKNGGRFYCTQHFGLSGTMKTRVEKKKISLVNKENVSNAAATLKTPEKAKTSLEGIVGLDLLDRGQTPERIEFENLAEISDPEEAHSQMDEDEWTDRNFGASTAEMGSSDDISDMSDSDEDNEVFEEAIDQPLTTEGTLELAKNWTLRYSHPHATIGQSDTGSNEYEDSSDEYTSEDDESGTATEDEEDVRARELRKQEVWLKVPPRSSDTDTGSETEVKHSQDSIDPAIVQESFISFESKVTSSSMSNINTNDSELSSDRNALEGLLEFSNETALASNELARSVHGQDNMTSAYKNGASLNVISQVSENVICATDSMPLSMPKNIADNVLDQNESLVLLTDIALNHLAKEDCNSEYESFVDENVRSYLDGSDNKIDDDCLQSDILDVDIKNLTSNSINFNVNNLSTNTPIKNSLDLSTNHLKEDSAKYNCLEVGSEEVAKITFSDTIPCIKTSKDSKVSDSETTLIADDLPGAITSSLNGSKSSLSSSSSEIYQSVEMLHSGNSTISDHLDDLIEYSKSNLPEKIKIFKCENISVTNQSEDSDFINKNRNVKFINDSNVIHVSNVTDKKVDIHLTTPMLTTSVLQKSIYPIVTVTSPSPTQEIQFEELSLETSRLLVPLESHSISNFGNCDNTFDKLKRDLKQRKEKNKAIGNGLRPLSTEYARLEMSKYFTESKKIIPKSQPTKSEGAEDTSNVEVVKLHIEPKLSNKVNAEEMLKYFNKSSPNNKKSKTSNIIAIKQNERRKLEIDIEEISNLSKKDIDAIDQQFNQIEEQNKSAYLKVDDMGYLSGFEVRNDEEGIACNSLDLTCNDCAELNPQSSIDSDYVDPVMSNNNIPKLQDNARDISYLHIDTDTDLNINNFELHTAMVSEISTLHTDVKNNIYFNITNDGKEQEKINPADNVLKSDISSINKGKEANVKLTSNEIDDDVIKGDNIIKPDVQSNILNNAVYEEKKAISMDLDGIILNNNSDEKQADKINIPSDDLDKDNKSNKNLFGHNLNTHLNAKLTTPLSLNNNTDKVIKCNRLHKSDTNLNEDTPRVFCKSMSNNTSKSLSELKNVICKDVSAIKATIIKKIIDTSTDIKDTITHNNLVQNCVEEVPKRPERKNLSYNINPFQKTPTAILNSTISNTELFPPEIPARKKSAKRSFKDLRRNQAVEDMPKLQSQTIENISKLHGQNNDVFNIQNQDGEKLSKVKSQDDKDIAKLTSREFNNAPKIQDIPNNDTNPMDIQRPSRRNVAKLRNRDIMNLSNVNKEIIKDVKDITIAENRDVAGTSRLQSQNKSISSTQEAHHHTNLDLFNKPEESIKIISSNILMLKVAVVSSEEASTEESVENSATEISTDSEFEHDEATPTQHEIPEITINDSYVRKTRGAYVELKKVQVKSKVISSINGNLTQDKRQQDISEQFLGDRTKNLESNKEVNCNVPASVDTNNCTPLLNPRKGDYLLNRTHSTGGIASRLSLELKKRYLLGGSALGGSVIKSGSASNVDTKLRNFTDAISQHQKLLNPAPEPSPTMQAFLQGTSKLRTNNAPLSPLSPTVLFSRQLSTDHCRNSLNDVAKPTTLIETSKAQQLPDLVKESSILKSKTAPNICNESSVKDGKLIDEQVFLQETNNLTKKASIASTIEDVKSSQNTEKVLSNNAEEGNGFRPRSPLHETSIVVPQVDWSRKNEDKDASSGDFEMDSDSLSSSDSNEAVEKQLAVNLLPPRLRIHSTDGDLLLDEGADRYTKLYDPDDGQTFEPDSIEVSFLRDRRLLDPIDNTVEMVNNNMERLDLRDDNRKSNCSSPTSEASAMSNKQDDSEENDVTTAAFTETEFSEWARDGEALVSDDLRDVELDINPNFITVRRNNAKLSCTPAKIAKEEDTELDYSKIDRLIDHEYPNNNTSKLLVNGEDINYMDTDNESLLDDSLQDASNIAMLKNRGYIEFVNIKTTLSNIPTSTNMCDLRIADAPIARLDLENDSYGEEEEEEGFKDANVIEIDPVTMEDVMGKLNEPNVSKSSMKSDIPVKDPNEGEFKENVKREQLAEAFNKELLQSMEEDSLLLVEPAEDTTTSEVVTVLASPINPQVSIIPVETTEKREEPAKADSSNPDYLEYVKRLQSRIAEFSNAKDSIDVRKSRRKNSKSLAQIRTAEMIAEEIKCQETMNVTVDSNGVNSPATSRKLEEITRERSKQKNLIQDLLMDKLEAHKQKSAEKKARRAARASSFTTALSPIKPSLSNSSSVGNKFVPTSIMSPVSSPTHTTFGEANKSLNLSMFSCPREQTDQEEAKEKIPKKADEEPITASLENSFKTPLAPPRLKSEEARRTAEKARQDARERARMKSDEDLGLSPEDRIKELRMKVTRRQLSMDDTKKDDTPKTERVKSYNFSTIDNSEPKLQISKSTDNMKNIAKKINFQKLPAAGAKSMDELLNTAGLSLSDNNSMATKRDKKKQKDSERRKSIIQAVSDFFFKKETSPSPNQKDKLSMFRLTSKSKGKIDKTVSSKCDTRPKSVCEDMLVGNFLRENPPPVPPPPLNYSAYATQVSDSSNREEADLLREWFDLMKERTELRRYEKELLVRAQEVQLEDRHERLQQELRERLADDDDKKTSDDVKKEGEILTEMLEIVAKRDSLIVLLEEERQRWYSHDDSHFE